MAGGLRPGPAACGAGTRRLRRGRRFQSRNLHLEERHGRCGHPQPPGPGGHPHGLVQGGFGRRASGQVGHRPFPRAPDVQGHPETGVGGVLQNPRPQRRARERLHVPGLHRLLPEHRRGPPGNGHGDGSRPHDQPGVRRQGGGAGKAGHIRGAPQPHRQQSLRPSRRARQRDALSQPPLPQADHRVGARGPRPDDRRYDVLLPAVVRAQQRHPGGRRRYYGGEAEAPGGEDLWPHPGGPGAAPGAPRRAAAQDRPPGDVEGSPRPPAFLEPHVPGPQLHRRGEGTRIRAPGPGRDPRRGRHQSAVPLTGRGTETGGVRGRLFRPQPAGSGHLRVSRQPPARRFHGEAGGGHGGGTGPGRR